MRMLSTQKIQLENCLSNKLWIKNIRPTCPFPEVKVFLFAHNNPVTGNEFSPLSLNDLKSHYIGSVYFYGLGNHMPDSTDLESLHASGQIVTGGLAEFDVLLDIEDVLQHVASPANGLIMFAVDTDESTDISHQQCFEYDRIILE